VRSGPALVLQFIVSLLGMDLERWSGRQLAGTAQPLLARVLFSGGSVRWNRRCEILSGKYVAALQLPDTAASHPYLSSLRFGFKFDNYELLSYVFGKLGVRRLQRDVVYLGRPIAPSYRYP
jgi:hypothetical protein